MRELKQQISECYIPIYMQDILTNNYCDNFLRMSMLRDGSDYTFKYQTDRYAKLDFRKLDLRDKLKLLRSIIIINERNKGILISAENYLIEPELIYSINNSVDTEDIRLLFYPDFKKMSFSKKLVHFAEKIKDICDPYEEKIIGHFEQIVETSDLNRAKLFLDKNIRRIEN